MSQYGARGADFEPSAPPAPPELAGYFDDGGAARTTFGKGGSAGMPQVPAPPAPAYVHHHVAPDGRVYEYETVQDRLLNVFGGFFRSILKHSHTVARIDLVRPISRFRHRRDGRSRRGDGADDSWHRGNAPLGYRGRDRGGSLVEGIDHGLYGEGARLKLLQVWGAPDKDGDTSPLPWGLNFAAGANFDVGHGQLKPKMRIQTRHVALHALPSPELELRGSWLLYHNIGLTVRCRAPLNSLTKFWERETGIYWTVRLFNPIGSGFHFTPGGLEFDERVVRIGKHTSMRVAASLLFPKELPWDEDDEDAWRIRINRLGLKTRLL